MKLSVQIRFIVFLVCIAIAAVAEKSLAQAPAAPKPPARAGAPQAQPAPDAAMQESMRLMMPGEAHKNLAKMAGKWTSKMKIWNTATPAAPPMESTGETETKLILGGRYLMEEAKGSVMGMSMQRMSIMGYDNFKKVYTMVFYSSMGTATDTCTGNFSADGKVLTLNGVFDEPQGKTPFKNVIRIEGDDVRIFESYKVLPDGKDQKVIEETYTRMK